jgi:hypothetical protein
MQGLNLQHHPRASPVGGVVHLAMHAFSIVTQIVQVQICHPTLKGLPHQP